MTHLVVGRDRAHVKTLLLQFPMSEVITARAFFDKVRRFAFINDEKLRRDDHAPLMLAMNALLSRPQFPLGLASQFSSLFSACYHGTETPSSVWEKIASEQVNFAPVFEVLAAVDEDLNRLSLVNGVSALFRAWQDIKRTKTLPPGLGKFTHISLRYLIDLTLLEIEVIKDLSRLGLRFDICFPLDFQKRGINAAVDFSARAFESCADLINIELSFDNVAKPGSVLSPLVEGLFKEAETVSLRRENCAINQAYDVISEADSVASEVAYLLKKTPKPHIAVVVRTIDARSKIYRRALKRYGIGVRDRKGIPLQETKAYMLLATLLSAKLWSLPKRDLISLINHPMFSFQVTEEKRAGILRLIHELGIDDRVLMPGVNRFHTLAKLFETEKTDAADFSQFLTNVLNLLSQLFDEQSFSSHLSSILSLLEKAFINHDDSFAALKAAIVALECSARAVGEMPAISLSEFVPLLMMELLRITVPREDVQDQNAIEFLLLPELLGREFDHVFIADISFGRMPKNDAPDPLIDDQARMMLNKLFKKPLLRIYLDDPFEPSPVPPRQALEPFWFASALASAKVSVNFSCASLDENGVEQAPSEFFLWLTNHVKLENDDDIKKPLLVSPSRHRFLEGVKDKYHPTERMSDAQQALLNRKAAFLDNVPGDYAFHIAPHSLLKGFKGCFSEPPSKALTPTMVEAFGACRFRGFAERLLLIDGRSYDHDDIDARVIGQIAHRTLELYVKKHKADEKIDHELLSRILMKVFRDHEKDNTVLNADVMICHLDWLKDSLMSLLYQLSKDPLLSSYKNYATELSFGLPHSKWPGVSIAVNGRRYLLGGRIDRLDRRENKFLVMDYKLSSISALKVELGQRHLLSRHFQMPIYVRLVAEHLTEKNPGHVSFSFASIRDGQMISFDFSDHPLAHRIFDDVAEDGLGQAIDRIFAPILEGHVMATAGEHCATCHLSHFCRKSEGEAYA